MYQFGVGNGAVREGHAEALEEIAAKHGAHFIAANMPEGPRYWFECENLGEPFDSDRQKTVLADAEAAGVWPIKAVL